MSDQRDLAILALQKHVLNLREQLAAEKDAREEAEAARRVDNGETWEDECMRARNQRDAAIARAEEAEDDRRRALKRADALTLDTQSCDEAVAALVDMVRTARSRAEEAKRIEDNVSNALKVRDAVARALADQDRLAEAERKLAECAASHDSLLGQVNTIALAVDLTIEASFAIILDRVKTLRCRAKSAEVASREEWRTMMNGHEWAPSPYTVESMGLEMFRQAKWLAVYGAFIASKAQQKLNDGRGAPDDEDVKRYAEEARALANMVAVAGGEPER